MQMIKWKNKGSVAVIEMCNGANRQNIEFTSQMHQCLDEILEDKTMNAVILTSFEEKHFCDGIDLEWMMGKMADKNFDDIKLFLHEINRVFKRLLLFPMPVIAAINGHAFGNGAMLACACDFRFMTSDKGFFCFPEVDINIPFLPGMIKFVKKAVPEYKFNEMLLTGKRAVAKELEDAHVLVKACGNREQLFEEALKFAETFSKHRTIFGELKKRKHKEIIEIMETEDVQNIDSLNLFFKE